MKNFYYVVAEESNGKYYAYVDKVHKDVNICGRWNPTFVKFVHQCETKKKAEELANYWNECYKANGTYMF